MEFTFPTVMVIPFTLGLLGFIEPCTVGAHMVFLRSVAEQPLASRLTAIAIFAVVRAGAMGAFGAAMALVGARLVGVQTALWVVFGLFYLAVAAAYAFGRDARLAYPVRLSPTAWKRAANPWVLGIAFGLNLPACAAPVLFGVIGIAAASSAVPLGALTMVVFAVALSFPLLALALLPVGPILLNSLAKSGGAGRWLLAAVFAALGAWSLWFGFFVDPADWSVI